MQISLNALNREKGAKVMRLLGIHGKKAYFLFSLIQVVLTTF